MSRHHTTLSFKKETSVSCVLLNTQEWDQRIVGWVLSTAQSKRGVFNNLLLERFRATCALKMDWFDMNYNFRVCTSQRSNRAWLLIMTAMNRSIKIVLHLWVHSHCTGGNWGTYFPPAETLLLQRGFCEGAHWSWHRQHMGSCTRLRLWAQHGRVARSWQARIRRRWQQWPLMNIVIQ